MGRVIMYQKHPHASGLECSVIQGGSYMSSAPLPPASLSYSVLSHAGPSTAMGGHMDGIPESLTSSASHIHSHSQGHMSQEARGLYCTSVGGQGPTMAYMPGPVCSTSSLGDHQGQQNHMGQQVCRHHRRYVPLLCSATVLGLCVE